MSPPDGNGWPEYRKWVVNELSDLSKWRVTTTKTQVEILEQVAALKVKSGIWGLIGGAIPVLIVLVIYLVTKQWQ